MPAENTRSTGADRRTTGDCHDAAQRNRAPEAKVSAAVDLLREHNIWRRGGDGPQTDPTALGIAIDVVVNALSAPAEADVQLVQATAPARIWLAVSDDPEDAAQPFPPPHDDLCWSTHDPIAVCVPYVRADLAQHPAAVTQPTVSAVSNAAVRQGDQPNG